MILARRARFFLSISPKWTLRSKRISSMYGLPRAKLPENETIFCSTIWRNHWNQWCERAHIHTNTIKCGKLFIFCQYKPSDGTIKRMKIGRKTLATAQKPSRIRQKKNGRRKQPNAMTEQQKQKQQQRNDGIDIGNDEDDTTDNSITQKPKHNEGKIQCSTPLAKDKRDRDKMKMFRRAHAPSVARAHKQWHTRCCRRCRRCCCCCYAKCDIQRHCDVSIRIHPSRCQCQCTDSRGKSPASHLQEKYFQFRARRWQMQTARCVRFV